MKLLSKEKFVFPWFLQLSSEEGYRKKTYKRQVRNCYRMVGDIKD